MTKFLGYYAVKVTHERWNIPRGSSYLEYEFTLYDLRIFERLTARDIAEESLGKIFVKLTKWQFLFQGLKHRQGTTRFVWSQDRWWTVPGHFTSLQRVRAP